MSRQKWVVMIIIDVIIILALIIYFGIIRPGNKVETSNENEKIDGVILVPPKPVRHFTLTASNGKSFTESNLNGHWTMMFFGFSNCGFVCPTTLSALNQMYQALEKKLPADKLPQVVMVSVDPDRDSLARMKSYVTTFNPHFIGARAEMKETVAIEKQFHIVAVKMQPDGKGDNNYSINHSAEILVFNPNGELKAYMSYPHQAEQMIKDYQLILKTESA